MDLTSLNTFLAIAESGSFSEAGERLHLTQPAVSKRIAALESQLGVRLFDRVGREVSLTEAGRALLPRAYQILNVLDDTRRALTNLSGEVSGRLVLATSHHIGLHRLPPLLRAFTRAHPQVALDMIVSGRHVPAPEALKLGILDEVIPDGSDLRAAGVAKARAVADIRPLPRVRDREAKAYVRLTIPIGRRPQRIDCNEVYQLEIQRLRREIELLRMNAE